MHEEERLIAEFESVLSLNEETELILSLQDSIAVNCKCSRCPPSGG